MHHTVLQAELTLHWYSPRLWIPDHLCRNNGLGHLRRGMSVCWFCEPVDFTASLLAVTHLGQCFKTMTYNLWYGFLELLMLAKVV